MYGRRRRKIVWDEVRGQIKMKGHDQERIKSNSKFCPEHEKEHKY